MPSIIRLNATYYETSGVPTTDFVQAEVLESKLVNLANSKCCLYAETSWKEGMPLKWLKVTVSLQKYSYILGRLLF